MTAALSAGGLVAGFAVAVASGSRPLGGLVLLACAAPCVWVWMRRDGRRVAARLSGCGILAFAASHLIGLVIGAWPAVLVVAAAMAGSAWRLSDSPARLRRGRMAGVATRP